MNDKFFNGFCDELEKIAVSPATVAKLKSMGKGAIAKMKGLPGKLRRAAKIGKWGLLGLLGYTAVKGAQGGSEAWRELKEEGHV